ncbi:hypothetical protein FO519_000355 [Halicephalobus sp. NKZ332]|nr:hypothetical protein FO519_000355 [Halicephalobus sp. NKZ332]
MALTKSEVKKVPLRAADIENKTSPILKLIIIGILILAVFGLLIISTTISLEKEYYTTLKGSNFHIRGRKIKHGEVYEGIIYGTNTLFGRPKLQPFQGEMNATDTAKACSVSPYGKSRICLYLNIYRCEQERRSSNQQVLVYVGTGRVRNSGPADLVPYVAVEKYACKGTILVSVNYRQSIFGYFSTGAENTGNNGVYDVKLALEWVQKNIGHFGGNARNVTVLAAGNGARVVSLLSRLPESKGLFHQLILSGESSFTPFSIRKPSYEGFRSSRWYSEKLGCTTNDSWPWDSQPNDPERVYNCLERLPLSDITALDEKSGAKELITWPFVVDQELVRSELLSSEETVGHSVPTLFLVCLDTELHQGSLYLSNQIRKLLQPIYELQLDQFQDLLEYYVRELTNETSQREMPTKQQHYKLINRIHNNFRLLGPSLLEAQATASGDVLTYFMFITNRKKEDAYMSQTPLCLGEDLFDSVKPLQKKFGRWRDNYGNTISEIVTNFIIRADPTLNSSSYIWPWYDPKSPEITVFDSSTQQGKVRPITEIETSIFWMCELGKKYLTPKILPRFCNTRKN